MFLSWLLSWWIFLPNFNGELASNKLNIVLWNFVSKKVLTHTSSWIRYFFCQYEFSTTKIYAVSYPYVYSYCNFGKIFKCNNSILILNLLAFLYFLIYKSYCVWTYFIWLSEHIMKYVTALQSIHKLILEIIHLTTVGCSLKLTALVPRPL